MAAYKEEFQRAIETTKSFGYDVSQITITDDRFINKVSQEKIKLNIKSMFDTWDFMSIPGMCVNIHKYLLSDVKTVFGCKAYFTLGYVRDRRKHTDLFSFTKEDLDKWRTYKVPNPWSLVFHAWITLESMEIIDASLLSTIASFAIQVDPRAKELVGKSVIGHPADIVKGIIKHRVVDPLSYHPIAIGEKILEDIGLTEQRYTII